MVASLKSCGIASAVQMVSNRWYKHFTRSGPTYLKISAARPSVPGALPFFNALMVVFTSSGWIGAASSSSVGCCGISSNTALSTTEVLFHTCSKCSAQRCTIADGSVNRILPLASFTAVAPLKLVLKTITDQYEEDIVMFLYSRGCLPNSFRKKITVTNKIHLY